ncbi:DnaJ C-terminal domain-containing protein [Thermorudis peleae]|uniref:DnaJ C-terminal domain-containing protein n=1 Tax=Thermorudis peleae TaxID=1382356 RepID=UPI00056F621B|nr:J domain-containing protein [Thermorudis peleae]MBX6753548.1 J domain-containing protein [Thermorudis peleae]
MEFKDYYKILGVPRDADEKTIKEAYRRLARKYHPDMNKGDPQAEEKFKEINEAYEVLKDPEKRARYDRFGADWERYQQTTGASASDFSEWLFGQRGTGTTAERRGTSGTGFSDFFDMLFGDLSDLFGGMATRDRARPRTRPQRGQDYEHQIDVSLREAYHGATRRITVTVDERCQACNGTGLDGRGICPVCGGTGYISRSKTLEVKIPAGVREGSRIRIAGQGGPGTAGGPPGDLYLRVHLIPDPRFELDGDNLRTEVEVPLYTAILGGEVVVPTLDRPVVLRIPPETQNGQVFRLRGKGMPSLKGGTPGDLLVRVKVVLPTKLSQEERRLFEQLRALRESHVHA